MCPAGNDLEQTVLEITRAPLSQRFEPIKELEHR
jgi:hypothetical protein